MLPLYTSIRPRRTPYTNYILIAVNVIIFLLTYGPHPATDELGKQIIINGKLQMESLRIWAQIFMLAPDRPQVWQYVSYAFLHAGWMHLLGNMYFLYFFGNNVNDKLGNIGYLCFYLAGAVFSGLGHSFISHSPVLGASGAVAAVTGGYMVLFPKSLITIIYWFIIIGTIEIPAFFFIGLKLIVIDNVINQSTEAIAYGAHIAGYAAGIIIAMMLLAFRLLPSDHSDMWSMLKQWNRRRRYRDTVSSGYDPFSGTSVRKNVKVKEVKKTSAQKQHDEQIMLIRTQISAFIAQRNLPQACKKYIELLEIEPNHVLPRQYQLDIANQMMSESDWPHAADAYEKFLEHYRTCEHTEQVQLMLGIIYSRYIKKPDLAIKHFKAARDKLSDQGQKKMCIDELAKLESTDLQ